jgi:hypothetical protein
MTRSITIETIRKRLRRALRQRKFAFEAGLAAEVKTLKDHYEEDSDDALIFLADTDAAGTLVVEAALGHLISLGEHILKPPGTAPASPLAMKLAASHRPWWLLAYELTCERKKEPDWSEVGAHPTYTPDQIVNRFIGEWSIRLADHHHTALWAKPHGPEKRSTEHETLLRDLGEGSPNFAHNLNDPRFLAGMEMARTYRQFEPVREGFSQRSLVLLGELVFIEELEGKKAEFKIEGDLGKDYITSEVQDYIRRIAELPSYGEWEKAKDPAKVLAMARAVQSTGVRGIAITVNLTQLSFGMANDVERETGSALQDRLRRYFASEFGTPLPFYFVIEHGLGQIPHLHGAVELEATQDNMRRVRRALRRLSRGEARRAPARWVDTAPFETPARWGAYAYKHPITSQSKTGVRSLLKATQSIRRAAKLEWAKLRQEQDDAKEIMRRVKAAA